MDYSIPRQQPAVVLRAHFNWLCALLAIALICVGGLTAAVGIVASGSADHAASARGGPPAQPSNGSDDDLTRGPLPAQLQKSNYEEGARGPLPARLPKTTYPEATQGPLPAQLPIVRSTP